LKKQQKKDVDIVSMAFILNDQSVDKQVSHLKLKACALSNEKTVMLISKKQNLYSY